MNDPGLHSPIQDGAKAVEEDQNAERKEHEVQEEDEQAFPQAKVESLDQRT